jgi:transcriptional regulator with XRE-family HTH domain
MRKSLRSPAHDQLLTLLRDARERAGLTQAELAQRLGRPQSFVAKVEGGERRLDLIEFIALAKALDARPADIVRTLEPTVALPDRPVRRGRRRLIVRRRSPADGGTSSR